MLRFLIYIGGVGENFRVGFYVFGVWGIFCEEFEDWGLQKTGVLSCLNIR